MRVIALIPARAGSKRVKSKNSKEFGGKPLVLWSIETAQRLRLPCFVSTDGDLIADISRRAGSEVIWRPTEAASDSATDLDVIKHALSQVFCDLLVYLRPTTPLRDPVVVLCAVKTMLDCRDYTGLRSVEEMSESVAKCFQRTKHGFLKPLTKGIDLTDKPNQELAKTYHPNGYVDIIRREIVDCGGLWGDRKYGYLTPATVELDTPEQWEYGEWWIRSKRWMKS